MQKWKNGEIGANVKKIIDQNFSDLEAYLSNSILSLPTSKKKTLPSNLLKSDIVVFDTTLQRWQKYNGETKLWEDYEFPHVGYTKYFAHSDWQSGTIIIPFSEHCTPNPLVQVFIEADSNYESVVGCAMVDALFNITLNTDLRFKGKVVVK
jgi:hypothetical protein